MERKVSFQQNEARPHGRMRFSVNTVYNSPGSLGNKLPLYGPPWYHPCPCGTNMHIGPAPSNGLRLTIVICIPVNWIPMPIHLTYPDRALKRLNLGNMYATMLDASSSII